MGWVTMHGTHVNIEKGWPKTGPPKMKMSLVTHKVKAKADKPKTRTKNNVVVQVKNNVVAQFEKD